MNKHGYIAEKQRRETRALTHWEAMQDKYGIEVFEYETHIGFSKWMPRSEGFVSVFSIERPMPHYYLFRGYFLLLIADTPAYELLPTLENEFYGDGVDLDYIEGLLLEYEHDGAIDSQSTLVVDDKSGMIRRLSNQLVDDELAAAGVSSFLIVKGGQAFSVRFEMIRNWIARKRASAGYVEVRQTPNDCDSPTHPAPYYASELQSPVASEPFLGLLLNYSPIELSKLLIELGLLTGEGHAAPVATPGAWVGIAHGLLEADPPRLIGSMAAFAKALASAYGAKVSDRAIQNGLGKRGSASEKFRDRVLRILDNK